jgi:hypothetical protein
MCDQPVNETARNLVPEEWPPRVTFCGLQRQGSRSVTLSPIGKHSIVIGAGIGGLAAAAAVSGHFERVTVLERDILPLNASSRPGTPQDNHLHVLLIGGQRALGELLPGFADDLARAGAVPIRLNLDFREELPDFDPFFPKRDLGWAFYLCRDRCLNFVARRNLQKLPNIGSRSAWS